MTTTVIGLLAWYSSEIVEVSSGDDVMEAIKGLKYRMQKFFTTIC